MLVSEVMTQAVVTADTGDSLRHVGELMRDRNVGSVVILEHERAVGAWHAEWSPLAEVLACTGGAASWMRQTLEGLEVDTARMRANIRDDDVLSEAAKFAPEARVPEDYLGSAGALVDRALAFYRESA